MKPNVYTITTAAKKVGLTAQYVRHAIKTGALISVLVSIEGRKEGVRHEILGKDLEAWRKGIGKRFGREDGRTKYFLYATAEELATLPTALQAHLTRAYVPKAKAAKLTLAVAK